MPGPDPRTRSRSTGTKRMGDPLREGKKGTSTRDPLKEDRERGGKTEDNQPQSQPLAKGGRAMYKSGMRVCKLAKRGKGRAYGKNS